MVEVAARLQGTIAERGMLARIGGDEFAALIFENTSAEGLLELVSELELVVSGEPVVADGTSA